MDPRDCIPSIVARCAQHRHGLPFSDFPEAARARSYQRLLECAVGWRGTDEAEVSFEHLVSAAVELGEHRRTIGASADSLIRELEILDRAVLDELRGQTLEVRVVASIQTAMAIVMSAAIQGYARRELEAKGDWDPAFDRLRAIWLK